MTVQALHGVTKKNYRFSASFSSDSAKTYVCIQKHGRKIFLIYVGLIIYFKNRLGICKY